MTVQSKCHGPLVFGLVLFYVRLAILFSIRCTSPSVEASRPSRPLPSLPEELAVSFDTETTFIPMVTNGSETIHAPVGHLADIKQVEVGTTAVVLVAFMYLLFAAYQTASRIDSRKQHHKVE
jgi:hypothetical protein